MSTCLLGIAFEMTYFMSSGNSVVLRFVLSALV